MRLIITEKPSVAKSISTVLGANMRRDGFVEGNGWIISWCFGHLAELASAEVYNEAYAKWNKAHLPIIPDNWQYSVGRDKKKQLDLLSSLMHRSDVTEVINACDAGREGELIFRTVFNLSGCAKPMKRLWISSMEDAAIREGFEKLKDGKEYDALYAAALCRSKADWLVGINMTRLFSVLYHRTLNVGRVVSPTLALLVERESEISAFRPEPFYTVNLKIGSSEMDGFTAVSEKFKSREAAEAVKAACGDAVIRSIECRQKLEIAPALYDLTTLQRDANRILGFTAQQTLDYAQSLYEKKLCTYPRTDSRHLTNDMENSVPEIAELAARVCGVTLSDVNVHQLCDSNRVSDHHAIIPTRSIGRQDLSALTAGEQQVLNLICRRLLVSLCSSYAYVETAVTLECGEHSFTAKGKRILHHGWKAFSDNDNKEVTLPELSEGEILHPTAADIKEGETVPPKHFTEDTLLAAMESAGAKEAPDDAERKGLGTAATRAGILEKLVSAGFVERKKSKKAVHLIPSEVGVSLITVLPEQLGSPLLTAEWEHMLKEIEHGELNAEVFMDGIGNMVSDLVRDYEVIDGAEVLFPSGKPIIGKCPRCGSTVTESKPGFFCEKRDCHFGLWKDNRYLSSKHIILTSKMVKALLTDGKTFVSGMYSEKTGKTYSAYLVLTDDGQRSGYSLEFEKENGA